MNNGNELTGKIIGAAIEVHRELGPGLLESAYQACLFDELKELGLNVEKELELPVIYKGRKIDVNYRIDLLVENTVIVELKSVENILPIHEAQVISYLKLAKRKIGLLINLNVPLLKQGIKRFILD